MKRTILLLAALALTVAVAVPAGFASGGVLRAKTPKIKLYDDYFSPTSKTIHAGKRGKKVKFLWKGVHPHNVTLTSSPKSLSKRDKKKFNSATGSSGSFSPKFKKKGTYKFICTVHPTSMKTKVKVK